MSIEIVCLRARPLVFSLAMAHQAAQRNIGRRQPCVGNPLLGRMGTGGRLATLRGEHRSAGAGGLASEGALSAA